MGKAFSSAQAASFQVRLTEAGPFSKVVIVKDNQYIYSQEPGSAEVKFTWRDTSAKSCKTSHYYVRGEQVDGEIVWVTPMWMTYTGKRLAGFGDTTGIGAKARHTRRTKNPSRAFITAEY
jgi:hypothetical protein